MTHKKPITKIIAGVLSVVMVFGVLMFVSPTEAQAISLNATDTGFYNLAYGANGETTFGEGAQIRVINATRDGKNKSDAIYTLTESGWAPAASDYVVWDGTDENTFYGVYPYNAEYNSFTIPTDQSGGVQDADWMTANYTAAKDEGNVNLHFHHCLAKVTVNITAWNSEFDGSEKVIEDLKIYSKGTALTATYSDSGATITATDGETGITPLVSGASYTAIVAPATYASTDKFMTFTACGQEMTVLGNSTLTNEGLQAGLHYLFDLKVGKDCVTLSSVTVSDWADGGTIDGGVATEVEATLNAAGYYEIGNADQLFWFAQQVNVEGNKEIKGALTADIDLKNKPWTPIGAMGEENSNFRGVFDGQNYTIRGLNVEGSENGVGFFGEVRTGTVKNFTIYGNVVVNTEVDCVGGVIGSVCGLNSTDHGLERNGAVIQNVTSYVNVTAKAHGIGMIGGFVGHANHESLIEQCAWYGTFDAGEYRVDDGAGGFIGKIQENTGEVTIRNCGAYGTIKTNYAGDYNNYPTIYMGGFLSFSNTGAKTTLENCLFAGKFERGANLTDEAELAAFGTLRSVNAIKNCYYLGDDGLAAVHSDSPLNLGSDNVKITSVPEDDLRNGTVATQLGECWEQGEHYPVIKK